jgi:glutamate-1-semialdehyde 2,1-aminomutase
MNQPVSAAPEFAISRWPDVADVYARLDALLEQPIRPIRRDNMEKVLGYFNERCQRSKALSTRAAEVIPGGLQHNLAFGYPFPLAMREARGAHLTDEDGNRYTDFLQAGGPTLLGSNDPYVLERVIETLRECGPVTGLLHEYEVKLAELICREVPSVEMFRMLASGTEGVMGAMRLARTYTKRKWVIKIGGAYHGWSDQMVYGMRIPGTGRYEAHGIPRASTAFIQESYPNDLDSVRRKLQLNRLRGGTAAIVVEPLGPESGTRPVTLEFNAGLRKLCDEFGALLVFDEVVSGFRVGMSGAQGFFGIKPDLTVFGKCITGGYPMAGGIGGRREVMASLAGGLGGANRKRAFVGGTLTANPLSCVAGYYTLEEIKKRNAAVVAGRAGDRLAAGLQDIMQRRNLPYVVYSQGSIVHLQTSAVLLLKVRNPVQLLREMKPRKHMMEEMGAAYMAHGLVTLAGSRLYTSAADTDAVIDDALNKFDDVFALV